MLFRLLVPDGTAEGVIRVRHIVHELEANQGLHEAIPDRASEPSMSLFSSSNWPPRGQRQVWRWFPSVTKNWWTAARERVLSVAVADPYPSPSGSP